MKTVCMKNVFFFFLSPQLRKTTIRNIARGTEKQYHEEYFHRPDETKENAKLNVKEVLAETKSKNKRIEDEQGKILKLPSRLKNG